MGRPTARTDEMIDDMLTRLSRGEDMKAICRTEGYPDSSTVRAWRRDDAELEKRFAEARQDGFDAIALEALSIVDTTPERIATEHGDKVDPGYVAWAAKRADLRLKLLSKWDPKRYGDRMDVGGVDDSPISVVVKRMVFQGDASR